MAAVIIRKKDLDNLGKEVLKELYKFLNDEYILSTFPEMKEEKQKFLNNLNVGNYTINDNVDLEKIFRIVSNLNFAYNELHEDLYAKAYAFKNIFSVYDNDNKFLEE